MKPCHSNINPFRWSVFLICMGFFSPVVFGSIDSMETREDVDAVIEKYTRLIKQNPKDGSHYIARGDAFFKIQDMDLAIADYTAALKIDDNLDNAWYGRGLALGRRGLVDEGIADLTVFLKRNPNSSLGFTKRGVRHLWRRDLESARSDLTRAIELNKNNAEAHDDLGVVMSLLENYDEANKHFLETIKIDPSYQKGHHNLAMSYYILGNDQRALKVINDALALKPDARDSQMLKAKILDVLGRKDEAAELLENAEFLPEGNWSEHIAIETSTVDPDLTLKGLDDKLHNFSDYIGKGKWTILNIWGPKCPPCIEEMPQLQAFHDDHTEKDATVIGMAIDYPSFGYAKKPDVIKFMELNSISYPMLLGDSELVSKFGGGKLIAVPTTLVYTPDGELKMSHTGLLTADMLEQFIDKSQSN